MNVYFDMEFTGLHQATTPISLGMVAETGTEFYAEFTDYDASQVDPWIQEHVVNNLILSSERDGVWIEPALVEGKNSCRVLGNKTYVEYYLSAWLRGLSESVDFRQLTLHGDHLAYDWVLLCELFGGALSLPDFIYYIPIDLATSLRECEYDPDVSREQFAQMRDIGALTKHNSLFDAHIVRRCFHALRGWSRSLRS